MRAASGPGRLSYIDWMRGLACVLMFQTHCYDSWLRPEVRKTKFFAWSQLLGTMPAPLFLFLAGISVALVIGKLQRKGLRVSQIARFTIRRGAEIFGLGLLFRLQEFLIAWRWAPWTDLLRVDILNTIGISMMLLGLLFWATAAARLQPPVQGLMAALIAAAISMLTPLLWTTWRPSWLPWPIESYVDGVHNLNVPQSWLFPIFPWSAFAFVGLAFGLFFLTDSKTLNTTMTALVGAAGIAFVFGGRWLDTIHMQLYPVHDFWHTSPDFFLMRVGFLLLVLAVAYLWCRWGLGGVGFSPMMQLGHTSLLVYWVHIEFVYGRFSLLHRRGASIWQASVGLLTIFIGMLLLSVLRTRLKGRGRILLAWARSYFGERVRANAA